MMMDTETPSTFCPEDDDIIQVVDEQGLEWYTHKVFPVENFVPEDKVQFEYTKSQPISIHNLFQATTLPFPDFVVEKIHETNPDVHFRQSRSKTHYTSSEFGAEGGRWSEQRVKFERHLQGIRNHQSADAISLRTHQSDPVHGGEQSSEHNTTKRNRKG
jgi:hypothetical protein